MYNRLTTTERKLITWEVLCYCMFTACQNRLGIHIGKILCRRPRKKKKTNKKTNKTNKTKGCSLCMGHSLCKLLNLGQKLKFRTTCQNRLCFHTVLILCKNRSEKYFRNEAMLKIGNLAEAIAYACHSLCKILDLGQILNCVKHIKIDYVFTLQ